MAHSAVITAIAANTSLGDAVTACAAARAGLARPAQLEVLAWVDEDGAVPVMGHPVRTVKGFHSGARLLSLGLPAILDLAARMALPPGEEVGLLVATPSLEARAKAARVDPAPNLHLLDRLAGAVALPAPPPLRREFPEGHAGFATALETALQLMAQGTLRACVVGGVDTLCDALAVDVLSATQRLKSGDNPVGLKPGEAAAFLLLETVESARRRKAPALARVTGVALAQEPRAVPEPPVGEGLFAALRQLFDASGPAPAGSTFYVLDRNGEAVRANDWGHCLQRLARTPGALPATEWDPATSFGDTGAASGALGAQAAVRAFARGYAPGSCAVVVSSSDGAHRGAIRIERGS